MPQSRRHFLTSAATGVFTLGAATGIVAGGDNQSNAGESFDPSDKDEIKSFLRSIDDKSQRGWQSTVEKLTQEQQEAIVDYLQVVSVEPPEFEANQVAGSSNVSQEESASVEPLGFDGYTTKSVTGRYVGRNGYNEKIWTFRQRLSYKWWYNTDVQIVSSSVRPSINFAPWRYVSTVDSSRTDFGDYADSYKQGKFQFCMGGKFGCIQTVLPFIEMRCYSKAGWRYEKRGTPGDCSGASC